MDSNIRTATDADIDAVVAVLTASFADDPLMCWAFPDPATRRRRLEGLWRFSATEAYVPRGASTMTPDGDSAALWLAPGDTLGREFWEARGPAFAEALDGDVGRLAAIGEVMGRHHPRTEDHWYLPAIGVAPERQGSRLGSALLAHTLATADAQGAAAYLEATSPRSRVLYERFGFRTTTELTVDGSPPLWPMWRAPAPPSPSRH